MTAEKKGPMETHKDPTKAHKLVTIYTCDSCGKRLSHEDAEKRDFMCCDKRMSEKTEEVPVPLGP